MAKIEINAENLIERLRTRGITKYYYYYCYFFCPYVISIGSDTNSQQPTANSQQPTANSQQPTANSHQLNLLMANSQQPFQQPTANSEQPTANSQQPTANSNIATGRNSNLLHKGFFVSLSKEFPTHLKNERHVYFNHKYMTQQHSDVVVNHKYMKYQKYMYHLDTFLKEPPLKNQRFLPNWGVLKMYRDGTRIYR